MDTAYHIPRRLRRNRRSEAIRQLLQETALTTNDFIFPLFLLKGKNKRIPIDSMPGMYRLSEDLIFNEIELCMKKGIRGFVIFPVVEEKEKDKKASLGYAKDSFYLHCLRRIKLSFPESWIITDVAMDPYSIDGHDGWVQDGKILNDKTLDILGQMALAQADTGIDMIGPSDMMDGRVGAIRQSLDNAGYTDTGIMAYTAKYASAFYGPFREALSSTPKHGDKKTYQMNPGNSDEAVQEAALDVQEGADILMVKPALAYLDIVHRLKSSFSLPVAAYNVSGEYAMVKAAAEKGWVDGEGVMMEMLLSIKRAGANLIFTYFAKEAADIL